MLAVAIFQFAVLLSTSRRLKRRSMPRCRRRSRRFKRKSTNLAAAAAADNAYLEGLPRAELKREAAIRREPQGKALVLTRGGKGLELAIKESRGNGASSYIATR